jgi:hypothetical protein
LAYDTSVVNKIIFKYNPSGNFPFNDFDLLENIKYSFTSSFASARITETGETPYQLLVPPASFAISGRNNITVNINVSGSETYKITSVVPNGASDIVK